MPGPRPTQFTAFEVATREYFIDEDTVLFHTLDAKEARTCYETTCRDPQYHNYLVLLIGIRKYRRSRYDNGRYTIDRREPRYSAV